MAQAFSVEVGFEFWLTPVQWRLEPAPNPHPRTGNDSGDLLMPISEQEQQRARQGDAWALRDEFFHLKQGDAKSLLNFFNKWGLWHVRTGDFELDLSYAVSVREVWQIQERFRRAVVSPISEWLTDNSVNVSPLAVFEPREKYPYFNLKANCCSLAILNTITLDLLRKVKFKICKRKDCRAPYAIESEHERTFCSQYCGHLESLRKNRREKAKARKRERENAKKAKSS
jgi:hypothetical protein